MNAMKGFCRAAFALVVSLMFLSSCNKMKDIKVTSFALESIAPKGFRAADAVVAIGIDNPTFAFRITRIDGVIKYRGEQVAKYTADTIDVGKKCVKVYDVPCSAVLGENVSLLQALSVLRSRSLEGFTTDVTARVQFRGGAGTTLTFKNLDINEMMND